MKKYLIILIPIFLIAGVFLIINNRNSSPTEKIGTDENPLTSAISFKDAILKNTPMKCKSVVEGDEGQGTMAGIIQGNQYIGQIKMEGKMSNVLIKESCMWSWQEGETSGFKMCFETTDEGLFPGMDPSQLAENVNCSPTIVSPSTFSPPSNINFIDVDDAMTGNLSEEQIQQLENMSEE